MQGVYRGLGDTRTPLYGTLACNAINVVLAPLLIFSLGWGVRGAAIATVASEACHTLDLAYFLLEVIWRNVMKEMFGMSQAAAAALLIGQLSQRHPLQFAGRSALANLSAFLGPTGMHNVHASMLSAAPELSLCS
jgi:Na+-driven multidrug efflux pump